MQMSEIENQLLRLEGELRDVAARLSLDEASVREQATNPRSEGRMASNAGQLLLLMLDCEKAKLKAAEADIRRLKARIVMLCPCCDHRIVHTPENCECVQDCPNAANQQ